jgi:hypothetical protein
MKKLTFLPAVMLPSTLQGKKVTGGKMMPDLFNIPMHVGGGPFPHLPFYFPFVSPSQFPLFTTRIFFSVGYSVLATPLLM